MSSAPKTASKTHPVFPHATQGPAARRIASDADIVDAVELFRLNYERSVARAPRH